MEVLNNRYKSFKSTKRTKASSSKSTSSKWPHPPTFKANPNSLAEAGFYFNPSVECPDSVTCFMCGKELDTWDQYDDPFDIHWEKCGFKCPWAATRCGLKSDLDGDGVTIRIIDPTRQPNSKTMERARLDTFTMHKLWPHDSVKSHGASSKKMARAGFVYTPEAVGDDTATCLYCNTALSGWDKDDDPLEEHRKRVLKSDVSCAFFLASDSSAIFAASSSQPPPTKKKASTRSVSQSKKAKPLPPTPEDDESDGEPSHLNQRHDSDDELAEAPVHRAGSKPPSSKQKASKKSSIAPSSHTRSSSLTSLATKTPASGSRTGSEMEAENEDENMGDDAAGARVSKSKSKKKPGSGRKIEVIEEEDEGSEEKEKVLATKKKPTKKASTIHAKAKRVPTVVDDFSDAEEDIEPTPASIPPKKLTHARTRSKANLIESESENAPPPVALGPSGSKKKKPSSVKAKPKTPVVNDDSEMEVEDVEADEFGVGNAKGKGRAASTRSKHSSVKSKEGSAKSSKGKGKAGDDSEVEIAGSQKGRAKKKVTVIEESDVEEEVQKSGKRKGKKKQVVQDSEDGDSEPSAPRVVVQTASKSKKVRSEFDDEEEEDNHVHSAAEEDMEDARTASFKSATEHIEEAHVEPPPTSPSPLPSPPPDLKALQTSSKLAEDDEELNNARKSSTASNDTGYATAGMDIDEPTELSSKTKNKGKGKKGKAVKSSVEDDDVVMGDVELDRRLPEPEESQPPKDGKPELSVSKKPPSRAGSFRVGSLVPKMVAISDSESEGGDEDAPISTTRAKGKKVAIVEDKPESSISLESKDSKLKKKSASKALDEHVRDSSNESQKSRKGKAKVEVIIPASSGKEPGKGTRPQHPSPVVEEKVEEDAQMVVSAPTTPTKSIRSTPPPTSKSKPSLPSSIHPFLSLIPMNQLSSLSEEECNMTIEDYIRREIEVQYQLFKEDGERKIKEFRARGEEAKRTIENA
ncbi:hypothetical protein ABKN59_002195 [Abortiporus biennis]